ncbi:MAG: tail fiber protein [Alistipes sp.]|nr:tail fiber protein [Alistipes sp.]
MGVYVGDNLVAGNVGEVYSKAQVDAMIANAVALAEPTGSIKPFAGTTIPDGYLLCDGSAVSRTTYAALFAVIGTTYGTGDGSTTFNLPDCRNRFIRQYWNNTSNIGFTTEGELPNITGKVTGDTFNYNNGAPIYWGATNGGALTDGYESTDYTVAAHSGSATYKRQSFISLDASRSSSIYGAGSGTNVIAKSITMQFCIKY